jgi:hypothetical protein
MAIAVVQNIAPGGSGVDEGISWSYTPTTPFTVGNTIVVAVSTFANPGQQTGVTVNGAAMTKDRALDVGPFAGHIEMWRISNIASSGNVVGTWSGDGSPVGNYVLRGILEISGLDNSSPLDQNPTPTTGTSTGPSISSGTLAQADEIAIALFGIGDASLGDPTITNPGTWTEVFRHGAWSTDAAGGCVYKIVSATTALTATWALTTSCGWGALMCTYKMSSGSEPVVTPARPALSFAHNF